VFLAKNKLKELHSVALIKVNTEVANFYFQFSFALWHCRSEAHVCSYRPR